MEAKVGGNLEVYGIGNPLIDVLAQATDEEIEEMQLNKGIMTLIDTERGNYILGQIKDREKIYSCGGSAPNTMITLAALGVRSALAGTVGNDELGD
ncbi:MAG: adenosine kinase, partial [Bacillota bacterium]